MENYIFLRQKVMTIVKCQWEEITRVEKLKIQERKSLINGEYSFCCCCFLIEGKREYMGVLMVKNKL